MQTPEWRLQGKNIFLTYPHAEFNKFNLFTFLNGIQTIRSAIICQEEHQDGSPHIHALISFGKKFSTRNSRIFDYEEHHPNIQTVKNLPASVNYVKKDNNYEEFGEPYEIKELNIYNLARSLTYEEFMETCRNKRVSARYAELAWKHCQIVDSTITTTNPNLPGPDEATVPNPILNFLTLTPNRRQCTVVIGPTGCGKTTWAIREAPKPALFISHLDQLKTFKANFHKAIIFDDMSFAHIPRDGQIHLTDNDQQRAIHIRYGVVIIPKGIVKIFTANARPFIDDPAINRRLNIINLY